MNFIASYFTVSGDVFPFGPTEISPFSLEHRLEAIKEAGYNGFGLVYEDLIYNTDLYGIKKLKEIIKKQNFKYLEFEFLTGWFDKGESRRTSDLMRYNFLTLANELEATMIKVAPKIDESPEVLNKSEITEEFYKLAEEAGKYGTEIMLEIMPFSNINNIQDAKDIVVNANSKHGGLLLDIWHLSRGKIPYQKIKEIPLEYIKGVELNDLERYPISPLWRDTINRRLLPGDGVANIDEFIRVLFEHGYNGPFGVEVISESFRKLSLHDMATKSYHAAMKCVKKNQEAG
jgi:sugar phosphate isomerase/epimerase